MVKKKLNVKRLGIFCGIVLVILILIIVFIMNLISEAKLRETIEYKLGEKGYTTKEIKTIKDTLEKEEIEDILKREYNSDLIKIIKEKYFMFKNLDGYLDYISENKSEEVSRVIAKVNVGANREWYSNIKETDTSKGSLMLVNKFNGLSEGYEPEDLTEISLSYAYDGNYVSEIMYEDLISMLNAAKENGFTIVVNQGYRSYESQDKAYKAIENASGESTADAQAARAGHSEYQTGLSFTLTPLYKNTNEIDISSSLEYDWLINNSYKYGFILRYPEGSSSLTGFQTDNWRYRYVGSNAASIIHNEGITFDEYYAYYVDK